MNLFLSYLSFTICSELLLQQTTKEILQCENEDLAKIEKDPKNNSFTIYSAAFEPKETILIKSDNQLEKKSKNLKIVKILKVF